MTQILFIAALFLIVLLALNFEFLLLPSLVAAGGGVFCILLGLGVFAYGTIQKRKSGLQDSSIRGGEKSTRAAGCAPAIAGGLYLLTGIGVLVLQAIGYPH